MQGYYGSFPATSKATAVSRKSGIRKVAISPVLNAVGPSGDERFDDLDEIPSPANPNRGPARVGPRTGDGTSILDKLKGNSGSSKGNTGSGASTGGQSSTGNSALADSPKNRMHLIVLGIAGVLVGVWVYRKFKK